MRRRAGRWRGAGKAGYADGVSSEALFNNPWHIVIEEGKATEHTQGAGLYYTPGHTLVVSDMGNHCIRRITTNGSVTTVAGMAGLHGYLDGPVAAALFTLPCGLALGDDGNIFVSDSGNHVIRVLRLRDGQVFTAPNPQP
jgi:hypothetical protein